MTTDTSKRGNDAGNGAFEHQDLRAAGVIYFLVILLAITAMLMFGLRGLYAYLDKRDNAEQPALSPLVTNAPTDTRHIPRNYPQSVFPSPKLEEDERGQLNGIRLAEEQTLSTYGWVDEKAGTVHIPIERAIELTAQRGLPVRPAGAAGGSSQAAEPNKKEKK